MLTLECMVKETEQEEAILTPAQLKQEFPLSEALKTDIQIKREQIKKILNKQDSRLIIIAGPCSIHNYESAIEFAKKLRPLQEQVQDKILLVMRAYVEKPRTTTGWKGLINDPDINETYDIEKGLALTRQLFCDIAQLGIPIATEFLEPDTHKYIGDLVSWAAIGARTSESQSHAERMSGLDIPIGFKNNTSGDIKTAVNAVIKATKPQVYQDTNEYGQYVKKSTTGDPYAHVILRGGKQPNYDESSIQQTLGLLQKAQLPQNIIVDCSHANSSKDYQKQPIVCEEVLKQRAYNPNIVGIMLEAYLKKGKQELRYGITNPLTLDPDTSITDACIDIKALKQLIQKAYEFA